MAALFRLRVVPFCGLVLLAAGCGSGPSTEKTAGDLSRPIDCRHLSATTLRSTECVHMRRVRAINPHARPAPRPHIARVPCKVKLIATFYAANDWLSLANALARHASPCAEYYISIPPIPGRDGTWTIPQPKEPEIIHHFGPGFHAMAEMRVWAWANWLKRHRGKSWYDAGVVARRRMVSAGYDFSLGDIWAVNELPITLPQSPSEQHAMVEFARGLYDGGPKQPSRQGLIWRVVPFQDDAEIVSARGQVQSWLREDWFWRRMSRYARFWSSEVFAFPSSSCAGTLVARTANVAAYVNALTLLAENGGKRDAVARAFLRSTYTPLENAAWQWTFGFGITTIPAEEMARFVSLQAYATAAFAKKHPRLQRPVRIGFAWAPKNTSKLPQGLFIAQSEQIADRLASALHAPFTPNGIFPGRACGRGGRDCRCKVPGAQLNPAWLRFPTWR